jgi:heme exporter protein A
VRVLEARDLACSRGTARLFREVTFGVTSGEWLALRGPNGSGKTTLLRCVAGLTRPDAGEVLWDGRRTGAAGSAFRGDLLYAGHAAGIKDDLTTAENLRDALSLRAAPATDDALRAALAHVGLDTRRHLPARRLSAGQRRRIGLARLALDPAPLWLLDEPLTALDDEAQRIFADLLRRHLERGGIALIATHADVTPAPARELRLGA